MILWKMIPRSPLMVCRAPQLLEREALFIHFILWSDMDRNPEMGGICSHLHFLPSSYPEALCLMLWFGKYWTLPATCLWFNSQSSLWGMVSLRWRKVCLAWGQIELHRCIRAQVSCALLCFPRGACCCWAMGERIGLPTGRGQAAGGVRAQTGTVSASWMWMAYFTEELIFRCECLGVSVVYLTLKIILKERQERKQQRLQENALSPAFPSDDVQDVQDEESGGDDQVLRPPDMLGIEFHWFAS